MKRKHSFQVIIERDESGYFVAECPALKACYTQGRTYEEVIENIKDVIALCLEELKRPPMIRFADTFFYLAVVNPREAASRRYPRGERIRRKP